MMTIQSTVGVSLCVLGVMTLFGGGACRSLEAESCPRGRSWGDKWFDGCHWCVCTSNGPQCSSSSCSTELVRQVAACHVLGQRWTDGCYRCRCRRQGITCRLATSCLLLRHSPVPCLADHRCVCGPDGVPSCTAEVIDRHAFAARRVDLGLPALLTVQDWAAPPSPSPSAPRRRQQIRWGKLEQSLDSSGDRRQRHWQKTQEQSQDSRVDRHQHRVSKTLETRHAVPKSSHHREKVTRDSVSVGTASDQPLDSDMAAATSSQELLITSDNLCRFGPRWYGGSLRCFCDLDGAITCGNPAFVSAFFDDFRVEREECEEEHAWEQGCSVCSCRVNGVVFCRHDRNCRHQQPDDDNGIDHYLTLLPGGEDERHVGEDEEDDDKEHEGEEDETEEAEEEEEEEEEGEMIPGPAVPSPRSRSTGQWRSERCLPGLHWRDGCLRCHCTRRGRPTCSRRQCREMEEDMERQKAEEEEREREVERERKEEREREVERERKEEREREVEREKEDVSRVQPHHRLPVSRPSLSNDALLNPPTLNPDLNRAPRGPMLLPPIPPSIYRPPAFSRPREPQGASRGCGRFSVGQRYWSDCNLCLCTPHGPRCQGKLCR